SHLGLPDLFNTETGESGIGRFGLMDGASIFAYNGLFPPSLSAWEKVRLGWAEPQELTYETPVTINVPADTPAGEENIYKVPISSGEYFLVENRHRDPSGNGITLTIRRPDGSLATQSFTNNDEAFVNQESGFDALLEPGVVVDVSHFDFALPGGLDRSNPDSQMPVELNGGILIWHIDEAVIRVNEPDNAINNNPDRRGVMLVEADGAQDIGRRVSVGLSENPVNGSPYDFWWSGNNATVVTAGGSISLYQNRFGPDTTPDNSSHSGSPSPFELFTFSDNQIVASFEIRPANPFPDLYRLIDSIDDLPLDVGVSSLDEYYSSYPLAVMPFRQNDNSRFLIPALDGYLLYDPVATEIIGPPIQLSSTVQPVIFDSGNGLAISEKPAGQPDSGMLSIFDLSASEPLLESEILLQERPVWLSVTNNSILDLGGTPSRYDLLAGQLTEDENGIVRRSAEVDNHQASITGQPLVLRFPGGTETFSIDVQEELSRLHPGVIRTGNGSIYFYLLKESGISLFGPDDRFRSEQVIHSGASYNRPAIADIDGDGLPDFIFSDLERNILAGVNLKGTTVSGFPVQAPEGYRFLGTPLVADIDSDGFQNLIIPAKNRYSTILLSYNQDGTPSEGFPLTVGPVSEQDSDPVNPAIIGTYLAAMSDSGDLKIWQFENMTNVLWPSVYGTGTDNKISAFISDADTEEPSFTLLNREETYNWPNPARNETYLRYQTRVASEISITITTMSGRSVYSDTILSRGGLPEELRIDTSGWASGAYFARIIASAGQQKESKTISIAVVK
ncbi:MAG: T9SS type A sorting domain-containing protein, partial [Balneolaceae bacterium]|nr:T9SS type A sorting domain-containing protein [Balneolaceae bacterium]